MRTNVLILHSTYTLTDASLSSYDHQHYRMTGVSNLQDALALLQKNRYALISVEITPPWLYAEQTLVTLRAATNAPILALVRGRNAPVFHFCLSVAHDCVWEPMAPDEITARAARLMEQYPIGPQALPHPEKIAYRELVILPQCYKVFVRDECVHLARKEYAILLFLAQHRNSLLSAEQIYTHVWREDSLYNVENAVSGQVHGLRKKLAQFSSEEYIETVWGEGYRFSGAGYG